MKKFTHHNDKCNALEGFWLCNFRHKYFYIIYKPWVDERDFESLDGDGFEKWFGGGGGVYHLVSGAAQIKDKHVTSLNILSPPSLH